MKTLKESLSRAQVQQVSKKVDQRANKKRKMSEREYVDLTEEDNSKQRKLESTTAPASSQNEHSLVGQELSSSQENATEDKNSVKTEGMDSLNYNSILLLVEKDIESTTIGNDSSSEHTIAPELLPSLSFQDCKLKHNLRFASGNNATCPEKRCAKVSSITLYNRLIIAFQKYKYCLYCQTWRNTPLEFPDREDRCDECKPRRVKYLTSAELRPGLPKFQQQKRMSVDARKVQAGASTTKDQPPVDKGEPSKNNNNNNTHSNSKNINNDNNNSSISISNISNNNNTKLQQLMSTALDEGSLQKDAISLPDLLPPSVSDTPTTPNPTVIKEETESMLVESTTQRASKTLSLKVEKDIEMTIMKEQQEAKAIFKSEPIQQCSKATPEFKGLSEPQNLPSNAFQSQPLPEALSARNQPKGSPQQKQQQQEQQPQQYIRQPPQRQLLQHQSQIIQTSLQRLPLRLAMEVNIGIPRDSPEHSTLPLNNNYHPHHILSHHSPQYHSHSSIHAQIHPYQLPITNSSPLLPPHREEWDPRPLYVSASSSPDHSVERPDLSPRTPSISPIHNFPGDEMTESPTSRSTEEDMTILLPGNLISSVRQNAYRRVPKLLVPRDGTRGPDLSAHPQEPHPQEHPPRLTHFPHPAPYAPRAIHSPHGPSPRNPQHLDRSLREAPVPFQHTLQHQQRPPSPKPYKPARTLVPPHTNPPNISDRLKLMQELEQKQRWLEEEYQQTLHQLQIVQDPEMHLPQNARTDTAPYGRIQEQPSPWATPNPPSFQLRAPPYSYRPHKDPYL